MFFDDSSLIKSKQTSNMEFKCHFQQALSIWSLLKAPLVAP